MGIGPGGHEQLLEEEIVLRALGVVLVGLVVVLLVVGAAVVLLRIRAEQRRPQPVAIAQFGGQGFDSVRLLTGLCG